MRRIVLLISIASLLPGCKDAAPTPSPRFAINGIGPTSGPFDTMLTISGSGFEPTLVGNQVAINGKSAEITSATSTILIVKVPRRAGTGVVAVTTNGGTVMGPEFNFKYTVDVTTLAGQTEIPGYVNGDPTVSRFNQPSEIKVGRDGNIYVSDRLNHTIRKITPGGITTTYTGSNTNPGSTNGNISVATYTEPNGLAYDKFGDAYLAEVSNSVIRKITTGGVVTLFSGMPPAPGYQNGEPLLSKYDSPEDCAVDENLNVYVTEFGNHTIRKLSSTGSSNTLVGGEGQGFADGMGTDALFDSPAGITMDAFGNLFVADYGNHRIRKVTRAGLVTTVAGNATPALLDGPTATALFQLPRDVAIDPDGNIYVADSGNNAIRIITPSGKVVTVAGFVTPGTANGSGSAARFNSPYALDVTADGVVYVADTQNQLIRKMVVR